MNKQYRVNLDAYTCLFMFIYMFPKGEDRMAEGVVDIVLLRFCYRVQSLRVILMGNFEKVTVTRILRENCA